MELARRTCNIPGSVTYLAHAARRHFYPLVRGPFTLVTKKKRRCLFLSVDSRLRDGWQDEDRAAEINLLTFLTALT